MLAHGLGGLSGPAIKPVGLACVWQIYDRVSIPIVGVGGISTVEDALEYLMAGARALEVGTVVTREGIGVFGRLAQGLSQRLDVTRVSRRSPTRWGPPTPTAPDTDRRPSLARLDRAAILRGK